MNNTINIKIKNIPELDKDFIPFIAYKKAYEKSCDKNGKKPLAVVIERDEQKKAVYQLSIHKDKEYREIDKIYVERLVKFLLWMKGGYKIYICGDEDIAEHIAREYSVGGKREFDVKFMERVYEGAFEVISLSYEQTPQENDIGFKVNGKLDGGRIGFDAGGSDMKICAVKDNEVLYSEEIEWLPKINNNPDYHYENINMAFDRAKEYLDEIDSVGISSAGIYISNRCMVASLFIKIPDKQFNEKIKDIYLNVTNQFADAKVCVLNDGDVAAFAGASAIGENNLLGIAMGTSEAAGYIDNNGEIKGWLNELAFAPVDLSERGTLHEWSGDIGCGAKYFSQDSVIKLAEKTSIKLDADLSPAQKLKVVQKLLAEGDNEAKKVYESVGVYLGHTLAFYNEMYSMKNVLLLGRVMSGKGGTIILEKAKDVLSDEYADKAHEIAIHLPDENSRRLGQAIAAASIP